MLLRSSGNNLLLRFVVVLLLVAVSAASRIWPLQSLGSSLAYITFYPSMMAAALYGGLTAGFLATVLSALTVIFWSPTGQPFIKHAGDWVGMYVFLFNGVLISFMAEAMHRAQARASKAQELELEIYKRKQAEEKLSKANAELEFRVEERTSELSAINEKLKITQEQLKQSEYLFKTIVETEPECIKIIDADGNLIFMNRAGLDMIQAESLELVKGQRVCTMIAPEYLNAFMKLTKDVCKGGSGTLTFEMIGLRGRHLWLESHAVPFRNEHGEITGLISVTRNITDRKKAADDLRESEARFRELVEKAPVAISISRDGKTIYVNDKFLTLYGFQNLDELVGQSIFDHWSPEYREIIRERAQKRARGEPVSSEYDALGQRKDGSRFPVHIVVESVELPDGKAFMAFLSDITDRKQFEDAVLKLSQAVEQSPVSIVITDIQGNMEFVNSKFTQMTGYNREEVLGKNPRILKTDHTPHEEYQRLWATITSGKVWAGEFLNRKKNGELFWEYATISPIMNSAGVITNYLGIKEDITQRKHLEAQLMQSQKLEALGQLTGGIAHDFNNMLTAIIGYGSLLRTKLEKDSSLKPFIDQILSSAEKSANLTQQLLAFSRKQIIEPKETDLNELIKGIEKLLLRLIGEDIDFKTQLEDKALTVMVDPSQIEQVLMNLCTNARDAMPDGGFLSITTDTAEMKEDNVKTYGLAKPGPYASISVTDSGKGMDEKTLERIFDPFFTTKELGKGTGLGLSIAYGIIKQHGGYITAYSEPGKGTTFRIYLPMLESKAVGAENTEVVAAKGGTETILIAEDNEDVRIVTRQVLEVAGYSVIEALDGEDAIGKFVKDKDNIHLVILDVIMPKKSGREVFDEIRKFKPYVRVLFSSGYTADVISRKSIMEDGMDFISKPAHPGKLLRKVREILDRRSR